MRRRDFIIILGGAVVACSSPLDARAQEAGRTYHLGVVSPFPCDAPGALVLFDEVRRRGFIEGKNLTTDCRDFGPHFDLSSEYAAELVKAQVDVIIAYGDVAIHAAQQATKTIPILAMTDDMVGSGFVSSLAQPPGNMTGVSMLATELDGKRQEVLLEAVPGLRRMAALADANTTATAKLNALQEAARARNIELSIQQIARGEEIAAAIDTAKASGATALNVLASPLLWGNRQLIMDRVADLHLPAIYQWPETAEEGGFAAYGPRFTQLFRELLARQLVALLRGTKIADIPVEQPTKFELVINLKTAKALGLTIPESFLLRADKLIE